MSKKPGKIVSTAVGEGSKTKQTPIGTSPAALAKRNLAKKIPWCPKDETEHDPMCDPDNPRHIYYKDISKAAMAIRKAIPPTLIMVSKVLRKIGTYSQIRCPCNFEVDIRSTVLIQKLLELQKSKNCEKFKMDLYYKVEIFHWTGSFHDRSALNVVQNLTKEQKSNGIITASLGNWALAIAYYCNKDSIRLMVVFPEKTSPAIISKCREYGAKIVFFGEDFADAKRQAFVLSAEMGSAYINGYDHPDVIAGSGSIGVEIMEQIPETDIIMVPVGGGGLLSGITAYVKQVKPEAQIYGIEPSRGCCFYKAMQNSRPFVSAGTMPCIADKLLIPLAGCNAFYTAQSNISKTVLVDDDWINRAILELAETENIVVEGAGATSLAPILAVPAVLPELQGKTVVCVITSGNIDYSTFPRNLQRAKAIEGRLIQFKVKLPSEGTHDQFQIYTVIASTGCNVVESYFRPAWITTNNIHYVWLHLKVKAFDLEQACTMKRVITKMFPDMCVFMEEPFSPTPTCACYPRKRFLELN